MLTYLNQRREKGQSTLEYAILIIIIIAALLSIQVYIKRGIQGRLHDAADDIGDQYSPGNQNVKLTTTVSSYTADTFKSGVTASTLLADETTKTDSSSNVVDIGLEHWGFK